MRASAPTVDSPASTIGGMKTMTPTLERSRTSSLLLYGLTLTLVLLAPALGIAAAAIAAWHSLLAGSIWYLPLGLVLVLATIAILKSHKPFDLALLGLLALGVIAWFRTDVLRQGLFLDSIQGLAAQTSLMVGLLLIMALVLAMLYTTRHFWPAPRQYVPA